MKPFAWVVPERSGGIRTYSEALWKELEPDLPKGSRIYFDDDLRELEALRPGLIHIQHEYGCWGSKVPGKYRFPGWISRARQISPDAKFVATAHSVIPLDYRYAVSGKGWQTPLRLAANLLAMPSLIRWWNEASWGTLDGVIVHSALQLEPIQRSGCPIVREIPHFVPDCELTSHTQQARAGTRRVLVFGYFTPDKGQDVAIRAISKLSADCELVLAGGSRTEKDTKYLKECEAVARELGVEKRVRVTGFIPSEELNQHYEEATLVLAPFRYTTGSGSIAHGLARGKPVLASDLPLNREIAERVPGSLAFFESENPADCARQIERLLGDASARQEHTRRAFEYARKYSIEETARAHLKVYEEVLKA